MVMRLLLLALVAQSAALQFHGGRSWFGNDDGGLRRMMAGGAGAAALAMRPASALAREPPLGDKLGAVPAYFVANARGSPYLLNKESEGAQECVIFLEPSDAEQLLSEMTQASPQLSDARVFCVGLDKAIGMLKRKPVSSGNVAKNGKQLVLRYRLAPSAKSLTSARSRLGKLFNQKMLPCFICPDLQIKGKTPVFMDIADLNKAWETAVPGGRQPNIDVHNLLDLVVASEQPDAQGDFDKLIFYPRPESLNYVRRNRRKGNLNSRLHVSI